MTQIPDGYKLIRLRNFDGSETLVLIDDELMARIRDLSEQDRTIVLEAAE